VRDRSVTSFVHADAGTQTAAGMSAAGRPSSLLMTGAGRQLTASDVAAALESSGSDCIVDISGQNINGLGRALDAHPSLRSINLAFNQLCDTKGFELLTELRELKLYGNKITSLSGLDK